MFTTMLLLPIDMVSAHGVEYIRRVAVKAKTINNRYDKLSYLYNEFEHHQGAEVGVWKGIMASQMLQRVPSIQKYYLVDPWVHLANWNKPFNTNNEEFTDVFNLAMNATKPWESKRVVLRGLSKEMAKEVEIASLDFVYIDGDHTAHGTKLDIMSWWPRLRIGGILYGDDFLDGLQHGKDYAPTAVKSVIVKFAAKFGVLLYELGGNQYMMVKTTK